MRIGYRNNLNPKVKAPTLTPCSQKPHRAAHRRHRAQPPKELVAHGLMSEWQMSLMQIDAETNAPLEGLVQIAGMNPQQQPQEN
jgi:hypothetical protein